MRSPFSISSIYFIHLLNFTLLKETQSLTSLTEGPTASLHHMIRCTLHMHIVRMCVIYAKSVQYEGLLPYEETIMK